MNLSQQKNWSHTETWMFRLYHNLNFNTSTKNGKLCCQTILFHYSGLHPSATDKACSHCYHLLNFKTSIENLTAKWQFTGLHISETEQKLSRRFLFLLEKKMSQQYNKLKKQEVMVLNSLYSHPGPSVYLHHQGFYPCHSSDHVSDDHSSPKWIPEKGRNCEWKLTETYMSKRKKWYLTWSVIKSKTSQAFLWSSPTVSCIIWQQTVTTDV